MSKEQAKGRIVAIDLMRGMTVAGMILVNNPGSWGHMYAPLQHASIDRRAGRYSAGRSCSA